MFGGRRHGVGAVTGGLVGDPPVTRGQSGDHQRTEMTTDFVGVIL